MKSKKSSAKTSKKKKKNKTLIRKVSKKSRKKSLKKPIKKTKSNKNLKSSKKKSLKKTKKKKSVKKSAKKLVAKTSKKTLKSQKKKTVKNPPAPRLASKKTKKSSSTFNLLHHLEKELEHLLKKDTRTPIKNSEGYEYCHEENCDQSATTDGYCRYHYMASWHLIKKRKEILSEDKLNKWIKLMIHRYSPSVLDFMIRDFSNEKDFSVALSEMKISQ